jgi:hypothetical protein
VRAEIYDSSKNLIYSDVKSFTLTALNSILASFKPFPCDVKGTYYFRAFTELSIDVDKTNDTVFKTFKIVRSNDVAITGILYPEDGRSLLPPVASKKPEALLTNVGDANQADYFYNYCEIYYGSSLIYRDSFFINSFRGPAQTLMFKNFQPTSNGYYTMKVYSSLELDQNRNNDTMISKFAVGLPDDVELLSIDPVENSALQINEKYPTGFTLRNNGYNPQNTPFPVVFKVTQGASIKYVKIINVTIGSGETKFFTIDTTLSLDKLLTYNVEVYSLLGEDFVRSNDTLKGVYYTAKEKDLTLSSILFPTITDTLLVNTQNVSPLVRIDNAGDSVLRGKFRVHIRIANANTGVVFYNKFTDTQLIDSSYLILGFQAFSINTSIPIKISAWVDHPEDQFRLNDTARANSLFLLLYDVKASLIELPVAGKTYGKSTPAIVPKVQINNLGVSTMPDFYARIIIKRIDTVSLQETVVYTDSALIQGLLSGSVVQFDMSQSFSVKDQFNGKYRCYLDILSDKDQILSNNHLQVDFRIDNTLGIYSLIMDRMSVYPNPTNHILTIKISDIQYLNMPVEIVDLNGKVIQSIQLQDLKTEIAVDNLSAGVYFLKTDFGLIKFVVE